MNAVLAQVIATAEASERYPYQDELNTLRTFAASGVQRIDIISVIAENASNIVATTFSEIDPSGYADTSRRIASCLRDIEVILRYIIYAFLAGDASILDNRCLNGLRETYSALGIPTISVISAMQKMKELIFKLLIFQEDQDEIQELTISNIRKLYPKQWVTIEVTKYKQGFPAQGKILYYNHEIAELTKITKQFSGGNIYTFFTNKIDEEPEPLIETGVNKIVISSEHKDLLTELASYFDRTVASIL